MAGKYDGSIRIDTRIDTKGADKGISTLTKSLKGFASMVGVAFGVGAIVKFGKAAVKASSDLSNAMTGLQSIAEGSGRSFAKANEFIQDYISDGLVPATNAVTAYKNLLARGYDTTQIEQIMTRLKDAAAFGRQASYSLGDAVSTATEGLKNENSVLVDNAGVTKNVAKMWQDYAKSIGTTANNLTMAQKRQAEYLGIMEETRFQVGDAAKITQTYSGQVSMLSFNFNNLKVALGNAIIPVLQAILPHINAVVNGLTRLANMLASFTSGIFGKAQITEGTQAAAGAAGDLAENVGAAGDAAEKAGKQAKKGLAAFDELNTLADTSSAGAGAGGGGGADIVLPGEIDTSELEDAADRVRNKFQEAADAIKRYYENNLTNSVSTAVGRVSDSVKNLLPTFQRVWGNIKRLGPPLEHWFNNSFAEYLHAWIDGVGIVLSGLIDTFNMVFGDIWDIVIFPSLKKWVVDILPFFTELATELVKTGTVLFTEIKKIFDMIWREGVAPALEVIRDIWLDLWDGVLVAWDKHGKPIFDGLRELIQNVADTLKNVWDTIIKPVWDKFIEVVRELWDKHLKPIWDDLMDLFGSVGEMVLAFMNNVLLPFVNWIVSTFGPKVAGVFSFVLDVAGTAFGGIADLIGGIITVAKGVVEFLTGVFTGDWSRAWDGVATILKGVWNGIVGTIEGAINIIIKGVNWLISQLNKISFSVPDWFPGDLGGKTFGFSISPLSNVALPRLAEGAVIPPNREFMAILGDQRAGKNIEAPAELIKQMVLEALAEMGGNVIELNQNINLDGEVVYRNQQRVAARHGRNLMPGVI